jgi:hypothetical protein
MRQDVFAFLRGTFYRWVQFWPEICPELNSTPEVLAVGDLHVENFGTWRDSEGRLIWGINDFDEAYPLPYANDLVRLASSALFAIGENHLDVDPGAACEQILAGYAEGLDAGGGPFVLEERHKRLRAMAFGNLRNPRRFWRRLCAQEKEKGLIPKNVRKMIDDLMPEPRLRYQFLARVSGLGSLGRYRVVAIANWHGGKVAREAKALAPSACEWTRKANRQSTIYYRLIIERAVRCRDPFVHANGLWLGRRLSPHCCRIPMDDLPTKRDEAHLLRAMGWETANVHLGSRSAIGAVARDLAKRPARWLHSASAAMAQAVTRDWKDWIDGNP